MLWAKRNAGKDDRKPPPINSHIEHESENPRSLKNWCRVVCEISCNVQIIAQIRAFRLSRILIGRESQLCTGRIVKTDVDASFYRVFLKPHDIREEERTQDSRDRPALSERSSEGRANTTARHKQGVVTQVRFLPFRLYIFS